MGIKEKIENNLALFYGVAVFAGFVAGASALAFVGVADVLKQQLEAETARADKAEAQAAALQVQVKHLSEQLDQTDNCGKPIVSNTPATEFAGPAMILGLEHSIDGKPVVVFSDPALANVPYAFGGKSAPFFLPAGTTIRSAGADPISVRAHCK